MSLRPFNLPADISLMVDLIPPSFQYPENPEWSLQADEAEGMVDSMRGIRRVWPVIRLVQLVSPPMRDILRGYVWEEDGKPVGLTNVMRMGATNCWMIGNVSVLPDYRRRGIARKLVEASMEYARSRRAKSIVLDVVAGNVPAYTLYEALGFEHYSGQANLSFEGNAPADSLPLPAGYAMTPSPTYNWRPRYELAQRITPDVEKKYMPVEEGRFRQPAFLRPLIPIIVKAQGVLPLRFDVRRDGQIVAIASGGARTRPGGVNRMGITLDPAHAALAPVLVNYMLREVQRLSPGRRIETDTRLLSGDLIAALEAAGFKKLSEYHSLGIII
jgi:GNAT superfamily N-acetyltransferase